MSTGFDLWGCAMNSVKKSVCLTISFAAGFLFLLLGVGSEKSFAVPQSGPVASVSVSPGELSFGIPTGTPAPLTSAQPVTVSITGSGQATLSNFSITGGAYAGDFTIAGNTCLAAQTAPTTCQISVQFTSTQAAGVLETAMLSFTSSTQTGALTVPLNGAYGAIELFSSIDINPSLITGSSWTQNPPNAGYSVQSNTINLTCPASGVTATLSSTPDGLSNVFQDNTIQVADTINGATTTTTNVCFGGDTNFQGFTGFPTGTTNCFQPSYESAAVGFLGEDPELVTGLIAMYGVSPVNLQNANSLYPPVLSSGTQAVSFQLTDAGGDLGAGTVHLVTNCSLAGITPGGNITGNPISSSPTQTYTFDSAPGQNISLENSVTAASGATFTPGIVPIVTDIAVPQQLFSQLVQNTSAAPSVCFRLSSELDYTVTPPAPMCKGFLIQCFNPADGTTTGDNCDPTSVNEVRNLYYATQFSSPDGPVNGFNFLYGPVGNPPADACSNVVPGGSCANGTGPGILMGGDNWLCATSGSPCPAAATTQTPVNPPTYSASNCTLTGSLAGALCPLDLLTEFEGAADMRGGSTTTGSNSVLVPVANMPLPTATAAIANQNTYGWIHGSSSISATFTSNEATYPAGGNIPSANGFAPATAAPPMSLTYGISTWPVLPDTTYPVVGDLTNANTNTSLTTPFCNTGGATPPTFPSAGSFNGLSDGMYNLHYFTTDCAFAEGLIFNPTGSALTSPTANWASFPFVTIGIDNVAPQVSSCTAAPSPVYNGWYNGNFSQSCTVTDQYTAGISGSGFLPLVANSIQGSPSEMVSVNTNAPANAVTVGAFATAVPANPTPGCDLAGNCVPVSTGPYNFDLQPPTIIGPTLSASGPYYVNGPPVTVTFTCSDGVGSGIASCTGNGPASSGGTLNTSTPGNFTFTVTAIDNVGNKTTSSVPYTVSTAPAADVAVGDIPVRLSIRRGTTGIYYPWAIDLSSNTANNVVVTSTFTVSNKVLSGSLTGSYSVVGCSKSGCNSGMKGGTSCSVNTTVGSSTTVAVLTCNVGQLMSISKLQGVLLGINIPTLSTANPNTTFSSVTTVTSDDDPNSKNNSVTETYIVTK
jgi:hypothetical protein